eukprot:Opistho-2@62725
MKMAATPVGGGTLLFLNDPLVAPDDIGARWSADFKTVEGAVAHLSELEGNKVLFAKVSESTEMHDVVVTGLVYGALATADTTAHIHRLGFVVRDQYAHACKLLRILVRDHFHRICEQPRKQLIGLLGALVDARAGDAQGVFAELLRRVAGGDVSPANVWLAQSALELLSRNERWLDANLSFLSLCVYTYICLVPSHMSGALDALREAECAFVVGALRRQWTACCVIGRDLLRALIEVARIPPFAQLWKDILHRPSNLADGFTGVVDLLRRPTPARYLAARIPVAMEAHLLFMLSSVHRGSERRHQGWFAERFLSTPESEGAIVDIVRYACVVHHPPNDVLASPVIQRWMLLGWLLRQVRTNATAASVKLALFLDWFAYDPKRDSVMLIEPALLLMCHSLPKYVSLSVNLLEFVTVMAAELYPPAASDIRASVSRAFRNAVDVGVIPALSMVTRHPAFPPTAASAFYATFPELLVEKQRGTGAVTGEPESQPHVPSQPSVKVHSAPPLTAHASSPLPHRVAGENDGEDMQTTPTVPAHSADTARGLAAMDVASLVASMAAITVTTPNPAPRMAAVVAALAIAFQQSESSSDSDIASTAALMCETVFSRSNAEDALFALFLEATVPEGSPPATWAFGIVVRTCMILRAKRVAVLLYAAKGEGLRRSIYARMLDALSVDLSAGLLDDLRTLVDMDVGRFYESLPSVYALHSDALLGNADVIAVIVSRMDAEQLFKLKLHAMSGSMTIVGPRSAECVIASLAWETLEQLFVWQLLSAECRGDYDYLGGVVTSIFHNINPAVHHEALSGVLSLLAEVCPTAAAVRDLSLATSARPDVSSVAECVFAAWIVRDVRMLCDSVETFIAENSGREAAFLRRVVRRAAGLPIVARHPSAFSAARELFHGMPVDEDGAEPLHKRQRTD